MARVRRDRLLDPALPESVRMRRALALDLADAALAAVDPREATIAALSDLSSARVSLLLAFGKAACAMTEGALARVAPDHTVVVCLAVPNGWIPSVEVHRGAHPLPHPDAASTGQRVASLARALGESDHALLLVSGGGSSMLELPADGVSIDEIAALTALAMANGAPIEALNVLRAGLSELKGGRLARLLAPASIMNVVLSDVPGLPTSWVASGPSVALRSGLDPLEVVRRYALTPSAPALRALARPEVSLDDVRIETRVAADHETARRAIVASARAAGVAVIDRPGVFDGEARDLGTLLAREAPGAWVWGGETVVTVRGGGRGGRNRELALAALNAGFRDGLLLAFGTDGVDGHPGAAGALIDAHLVADLPREGLDLGRILDDNDSAPFFERFGAALIVEEGASGTNVADLLLRLP